MNIHLKQKKIILFIVYDWSNLSSLSWETKNLQHFFLLKIIILKDNNGFYSFFALTSDFIHKRDLLYSLNVFKVKKVFWPSNKFTSRSSKSFGDKTKIEFLNVNWIYKIIRSKNWWLKQFKSTKKLDIYVKLTEKSNTVLKIIVT